VSGIVYIQYVHKCALKLAFHDADADTDTESDSPDTSMHPYVRYARFPREEVRVGVGVRLDAVEYQLNMCLSANGSTEQRGAQRFQPHVERFVERHAS